MLEKWQRVCIAIDATGGLEKELAHALAAENPKGLPRPVLQTRNPRGLSHPILTSSFRADKMRSASRKLIAPRDPWPGKKSCPAARRATCLAFPALKPCPSHCPPLRSPGRD